MSLLAYIPPRVMVLLDPAFLLYWAIEAYITVLVSSVLHGEIPSDVRGKAFGQFWTKISGAPPDPSVPLVGSATLVPPIMAQVTGKVLEVGPGSGNQIGYYDAAAHQISVMYGAEPATELHGLLRKNADATKLARKYVILKAGADREQIARQLLEHGIVTSSDEANGMFDSVVCVRVLCSVPHLAATVRDLHQLLRPGGRLFVVEHTANPWRTAKGSVVARLVQTVYMLLGWSYFVGDCSLTKDIEDELRRDTTQRWSSVVIERHFGKSVLTYIAGVLIKR